MKKMKLSHTIQKTPLAWGWTGFTLVEILLSLAVLGVGLVGILSVFIVGANTVRRGVEKTEACFIAQMVFEDFKRQGHLDSPGDLTVLTEAEISTYYPNYRVITSPATPTLGNFVTLDVKKGSGESWRPIEHFTSCISRYAP